MLKQPTKFKTSYCFNQGNIDIKATFGDKVIGTLESIRITRSTNHNNKKAAGSIVFLQFDTEPLMEQLSETKYLCFIEDTDDLRPEYQGALTWYADQIPPFDIVLTAANKYGLVSTMKILGVELIHNGYGCTPDDIVSKHKYRYIANGILPWTCNDNIHSDNEIVEEDRTGQIYNPYTDKWSWL
jgi:hypothetical protein